MQLHWLSTFALSCSHNLYFFYITWATVYFLHYNPISYKFVFITYKHQRMQFHWLQAYNKLNLKAKVRNTAIILTIINWQISKQMVVMMVTSGKNIPRKLFKEMLHMGLTSVQYF